MADVNKEFLDLQGLERYNSDIKTYIDSKIGNSGGSKIIKNQTLTFTNLVATISDTDITADSDFAVYYYNIAAAEAADITAVSSSGTITFTAQNNPSSTIVVDVVLFDVSGENNTGLPSYYNVEFETTKASLFNLLSIYPECLNLVFMTDLHFSSKNGGYHPELLRDPLFRTIKAAKKFMAQMPIDMFVLGGDYMQFDANNTTKQMGIDNITELNELVDGSAIPTFLLTGNHDAHYNGGTGVGLSNNELFALLSRKNIYPYDIEMVSLNTGVMLNSKAHLCCVFISTSSSAETASVVSRDWGGVRTINSNNYPVVIFNHFGSTDAAQDDVDSDIKTCIDTIQTAGDTIIAWISGHKHFDWVHVYNNTLVISILNSGYWTNNQGQDGQIYNKTVETANESAFSVISVNPITGKLYVFRFGAGVDFECNYNTTSGAVGRIGYLPTDTCTITQNLLGGTGSTNSSTIISTGSSYNNTITVPDSHFTIGTVTVLMNGNDITSTAYNASTHAISIPSVTGNITVTANATNDYILAVAELGSFEQYNNSTPASAEYLGSNDFSMYTDYRNSGINAYADLHSAVAQSENWYLKADSVDIGDYANTGWVIRAYFYDSNGNQLGSNVDFLTSSTEVTSIVNGRSGWIGSSIVGAVRVKVEIRTSNNTTTPIGVRFTNLRLQSTNN